MGPVAIAIMAGVAGVTFIVAGAMVVRDLTGRKESGAQRLDRLAGGAASASAAEESGVSLWHSDEPSAWQQYFGWLPRPVSIDKLALQADVRMDATGFVAISFGLALAGALMGWVLTNSWLWPPLMGAALGLLPTVWLLMRRRKRLRRIGEQLPDALDLLGRALRAGHSLTAGLGVIAEEMAAPISQEFSRVYEEQNLGIPLEEAMDAMTDRVPQVDMRFFVTAVLIQRQTGGDLAEILDKLGYVIRERFKVYGQVQALTAEGRLSGVVLMVLPILIFFGVYQINRPYLELLFSDPMGRTMMTVAIVLQIAGALVIRKIVNIKV